MYTVTCYDTFKILRGIRRCFTTVACVVQRRHPHTLTVAPRAVASWRFRGSSWAGPVAKNIAPAPPLQPCKSSTTPQPRECTKASLDQATPLQPRPMLSTSSLCEPHLSGVQLQCSPDILYSDPAAIEWPQSQLWARWEREVSARILLGCLNDAYRAYKPNDGPQAIQVSFESSPAAIFKAG